MSNHILVTGGAGYIGSHMVRTLLENGYEPIVFDNLSTGYRIFVPKRVPFIKGDLKNKKDIEDVFKKYKIDAVMHFAASIVVPESVEKPLMYYENNVVSCINLLNVMVERNVKKFIFSSTAAVYGNPKKSPVKEEDVVRPNNPYGRTKAIIEKILLDLSEAEDFNYIALRYFNVGGAHRSGEVGESHNPETHLIPNILKSIKGENKEFTLYGVNYSTKDGTCIRDYIHIEDLCGAHLLALKRLLKTNKSDVFNLGSNKGFSVLEVIEMAEKVAQVKVNIKTAPKRAGDSVKLVASSAKAKEILGWQPKRSLSEIITSAWKWERQG